MSANEKRLSGLRGDYQAVPRTTAAAAVAAARAAVGGLAGNLDSTYRLV